MLSHTGIEFFVSLPASDLKEYSSAINDVLDEIEKKVNQQDG